MTTKKPFLGLNIDKQLLDRIEDFKWNNRISSRAKAIEIILIAGMNAMKDEYPELDLNAKLETGKKDADDVVTYHETMDA